MTPFAQLGHIRKQASAAPGYRYQKTSTGLNDPYLPQVSKAPAGMSPNFEMTGDLIAGAAGMIPGIGGVINGVWQGGKAIYHTSTGQYGKAAEDVAWGAAGFIPGAAAAGAAGRAARLATKIPGAARAVATAGRAASAAKPALQATRAGGLAAKAAPLATAAKPFAKELVGDSITGTAAAGVSSAMRLKNNPDYQLPTAPPPTPANPFSDSQIQSALSGDF
jgi:hypothetical protein